MSARTRTALRGAAVLLGSSLAVSCVLTASAAAEGTEPAAEHGHMLVLDVRFTEQGLTFRRCVDVAAGGALPLHAHHDHLHHGRAADALERTGNVVVPTAPLSEFADCAALEQAFRG